MTQGRCTACGHTMKPDALAIREGENTYCDEGCYSVRLIPETMAQRRVSGHRSNTMRSYTGATRRGGRVIGPSTIHETPLPAFARRNAH